MSIEERDDYGMYKNKNGKGPAPEMMGAVTLVGAHVRNAQGEHLGVIQEMMVDMKSGAIAYVLLSRARFVELGDRLHPVPWAALAPDAQSGAFLLPVSKARLQDAPAFDTDHWPDMADDAWKGAVHAWYGTAV